MLKLRVKAKRGHDLYDNFHRIADGLFDDQFRLEKISDDSAGNSSEFGSGDSELSDFSVIFSAKMLEAPDEEFCKQVMEAMQELFGRTALITKEKFTKP